MKKMETPNKAEKFWDRTASYYDKAEKYDVSFKIFIEKAEKYLKSGDILLDFGCGTGLVCNEVADKVKNIYAIDISSKMIKIAADKASERRIQNIEYIHSTLFDERFITDSLDVILVVNVLHLLDDPQKVIQRLNKLLKPGGIIISVTPCLGDKPLFYSLFSVGVRIGIMPKIKSFKISELEHFFVKGKFEIIETDCLKQNSPQYLLIARK